MSPEQFNQISFVFEAIRTGSVALALALGLWAFYTGKVVSQAMYEGMTHTIVSRVLEAVLPTIQDCLKPTVKEALDEYFQENGVRVVHIRHADKDHNKEREG